jgi:hypothetical protein
VLDQRVATAAQGNTHGIETVKGSRVAVAAEPVARDALDLAPLERRDRLQRMTVPGSRASLHLDERHEIIAAHDEIDLAVAEAEVAIEDHVPACLEVTGSESLAESTQIPRCGQLTVPQLKAYAL